jgi:urea transport system ATP-binding protein
MLSVHGLSFSYGGAHIFEDAGFSAPIDRVTCIIGPNGAGKTTLLKNVMGLLRPSAGSISLDGQSLDHLGANQRAKAGLSLVPQGRHVFPKLSVEQNLLVGLEARAENRIRSVPPALYEQFPKLKSIADRAAGRLSGGEQQQLAIARALIGEPKALLLDEPTEGIDRKTVEEIGVLLRKLARDMHLAVVLVEQDLHFVKRYGDVFHWMDRGTVGRCLPIGELNDAFLASTKRQRRSAS